jgi:hypothetical protein
MRTIHVVRVLCVFVLFLRVSEYIFRGVKVSLWGVCQTVRTEGSDRPWVGRTVHLETTDYPRDTSCSRIVRGQGTDRSLFKVWY